jgi:Nif-specific regulatory protein
MASSPATGEAFFILNRSAAAVAAGDNGVRNGRRLCFGLMEQVMRGSQSKSLHQQPADRHAEELALLYEVSKTLATGREMAPMLAQVLALLETRLGLGHGMLVLLDPQTDELVIDVAHGFTEEERARGRYRVGEGITGAVFESGAPRLIPDLSTEPKFLHRAIRRDLSGAGLSMLAVPVKINAETVGVLSVDRPGGADRAVLERELQLLTVAATMIGQVVQARKLVVPPLPMPSSETQSASAGIVGQSRVMQKLLDLVKRVAPSRATVLLRGESGTGKELLAHIIHALSPRRDRRFVAVHCASLPVTLLESELFGHERGAFTGAVALRQGRFELADGGTLFLDEVGEIPLSVQTKLLRVIQEREFERVGGQRTIRVDVRIIAATHRPLEQLVRSGDFREDLYYRFNVIPMAVPPLRERTEDLPLLVEHFVARFNREHGKAVSISSAAMALLSDYHWPGNVRELEHCLERLVLLTTRPVITSDEIDALAHFLDLPSAPSSGELSSASASLPQSVEELERARVLDALTRSGWVQARAARRLGLTPRQLSYRIKKYQLQPPEESE